MCVKKAWRLMGTVFMGGGGTSKCGTKTFGGNKNMVAKSFALLKRNKDANKSIEASKFAKNFMLQFSFLACKPILPVISCPLPYRPCASYGTLTFYFSSHRWRLVPSFFGINEFSVYLTVGKSTPNSALPLLAKAPVTQTPAVGIKGNGANIMVK